MAYSLVVGDLEPDMEIDCTTNGQAANLTSATSQQLRWLRPDNSVVTVGLSAIDLSSGRLKRVWSSGDTVLAGTHYGQVVVTLSNGEVQTFPSDGSSVIWNVYPQLGTSPGLPSVVTQASATAFYTATGSEGTDFTVQIGQVMATNTYKIVWSTAGVASEPVLDLPQGAGDRTQTQFRVVLAHALTTGDKLVFLLFP